MENYKISSIISSSSKVSQYLEKASSEVAATNLEKGTSFLQEMETVSDALSDKYGAVKDTIESMANKRLEILENLTSAIVGRFYGRNILSSFNKLEKFSKSYNILNLDNNDNSLYKLISSIIINTSLNKYGNKSLSELGESVYNIFNELKGAMDFNADIDIDENGTITGMNNIYSLLGSPYLKGTLAFYTISNADLEKASEDDISGYLKPYDGVIDSEVSSDKETRLIVQPSLEILSDIVLENGSSASPYVIRNSEDIDRTGMNTITISSGNYYGIYSDLELSPEDFNGNDTIILSGYEINGNNHRVILNNFKSIQINATNIKNLNLILKNTLDRDGDRKLDTPVSINLNYMPLTKYSSSATDKPFMIYLAPEMGDLQGIVGGVYETPLVSYNFILDRIMFLNNEGNGVNMEEVYQDGIIPLIVNNHCKLTVKTGNPSLGNLKYGVTSSNWIAQVFKTPCLYIDKESTTDEVTEYLLGDNENNEWYNVILNLIGNAGETLKDLKVFDRDGSKYPAKVSDTPYESFPKEHEFFGRYYVVVPDADGYFYLQNITAENSLSEDAKMVIYGGPMRVDEYRDFLFQNYGDYPIRYSISDKAINRIEFGNYVFDYNQNPVYIPGATYSNDSSESIHFSKFNPELDHLESGDLDIFTEFIYYLALVSRAKFYSSKSTVLANTQLHSDAAYLYSIIEKTLLKVEENKNKYYNSAIDFLKSYESIENTRYEKDPNYSNTYLTNLFALREKISESILSVSGLSDIEGAGDAINYEDIYSSAKIHLNMFNQECLNLIVPLTQCLIEYNDYLADCLNMFTSVSAKARENLTKFADSLNALRMDIGDSSFNFIGYASIRPYSAWRDTLITKYFSAPEELLVQIYLFQEIALNMNSMSVYDVSDEAIVYKTAVNDAFDRIYRSALIEVSAKYSNGLKLEKELLDKYGVFVSSAPQYEVLPVSLTGIIPELIDLNRMDISNLLLDVANLEKDPTIKFIDLAIIKYLFSSPKANSISERYDLIHNELMKVDYAFKSLLVRYRLNKIYYNIIELSEQEKTIYKETIGRDGKAEVFDEIGDVIELLSKYISVWLYKYYSTYSAYGSSLIYIGDENLIKFLFGNDKKSYEILYEKKKTIDDYVAGLGNDIQVLWNNFVEWIKF